MWVVGEEARGGLQLALGHQGPESVPAEMFAQFQEKKKKNRMNEPGRRYLHCLSQRQRGLCRSTLTPCKYFRLLPCAMFPLTKFSPAHVSSRSMNYLIRPPFIRKKTCFTRKCAVLENCPSQCHKGQGNTLILAGFCRVCFWLTTFGYFQNFEKKKAKT